MAKNKNYGLLNMLKENRKRVDHLTAQIYSAFAIELHRGGMSEELINTVFANTNEIWTESLNQGIDIVEMCYEETGIEIRTVIENERLSNE